MLIPILITVAALVVVVIIAVALRPTDFRYTRSTTVNAPAAIVFDQVNNLRHWEAWSPWAKLDPTMKETYEGPPAGVGAKHHWVGNKKVGEGRMTITQSKPNELVVILLQFIKPFAATNTTEFVFAPQAGQTLVTWSMFGKNNFMAKAFGMFVNIEKMIGKDFDKGLAAMKQVAESKAPASI